MDVIGGGGGRRRAAGLTLLVACCCLAVAAAAVLLTRHGAAKGAASGDRTKAELRTLLDRRAKAMLDHDEGAFLGTVDPRSTGFRDQQRARFENMAEVPFASWSYTLRGVSPAGAQRVGAEVEWDYRVKGYDDSPVVSTEKLLFAEEDGRWRLSGQDQDADGSAAAQLWDFGPVHAVRGAHSLVLGLDEPAVLRPYADLADQAVSTVDSVWKGGWSRRPVIEVPRSQDEMAKLVGAPSGSYRQTAAVTTGEAGGTEAAPSDRVIINPQAFAELSALGRRVVVTHETTHVATRQLTTSRTPLWLSEGFADWVGYLGTGRGAAQVAPELRADLRGGEHLDRLPSDTDFAAGASAAPQAYEKAWLACRMIADRYGQDKLVRLYTSVGRSGAGGTGSAVDASMRQVLGISLDRFTQEWRDYTAGQLG